MYILFITLEEYQPCDLHKQTSHELFKKINY